MCRLSNLTSIPQTNEFTSKSIPMHPDKVCRERVQVLTDLPNIGKAGAADLVVLGILHPQQLIGRDPFQMHQELCVLTQQRHDPCVIDVFMSITRFMAGEPAQAWWNFTEERKKILARADLAELIGRVIKND
jgi:hypothetical protein